ncbi:DnaD domain-containing protein [Listeria seeligeri]
MLHQKLIMIEILLRVNHTDGTWFNKKTGNKVQVKAGQVITSINKIKNEWFKNEKQISDKKIRNSLEKLQKLDFLAIETTNSYTLLTVCKYSDYQEKENKKGKQNDKRGANEGQAEGEQRASKGQQYKNVKNVKNEKKDNNINNSDLNFKDFWEQSGFGMMLPIEQEKLLAWVDDFSGNREIVFKALEVTSEQGASKRNYAYVNKILRNWEERGFKTVADVNAAEEERRKQNEQKYNKPAYGKYNKQTKQEVLPDWFDNEVKLQVSTTESESSGDLEKKVAEIKAKLAERDEVQT